MSLVKTHPVSLKENLLHICDTLHIEYQESDTRPILQKMIDDVAGINIANDTQIRTLIKQIKTDHKDKQTSDGAEKTPSPIEVNDPNISDISVISQSQSLFSQMSEPHLENTLTQTEEDIWARLERLVLNSVEHAHKMTVTTTTATTTTTTTWKSTLRYEQSVTASSESTSKPTGDAW